MTTTKTLLFVVNVDWFFISHRLPIAERALHEGYRVHIACGITDKKKFLEKMGFIVHPLNISRGGTNFIQEIKTFTEIFTLIRNIQPDIVHMVTIKPVLYGGIASKFSNVKHTVFAISGLGYVFTSDTLKAQLLKRIVVSLYKFALGNKNSTVIVQNKDDMNILLRHRITSQQQIELIRGSGVDLDKYRYLPESYPPITIVMASRLLRDKGVYEYIAAAKHISKNTDKEISFRLYGDIDPDNPASLTEEEIRQIKKDNVVTLHGFSDNIADVFSNANIVVLPSYREGLPKVLIEAAACGRAVVTTDVPGCRDAIEPEVTGLLCRVKESNDLAEKIAYLIHDDTRRVQMGERGRELAEREFDIEKVIHTHLKIYAKAWK